MSDISEKIRSEKINENMNEKVGIKPRIMNEKQMHENHASEKSREEADSKPTDKPMPILTQNRYSRIGHGIVWISAGIFEIPQNSVCQNISMVLFIFACFLLLRVELGSTESDDEMSIGNLTKAKALTQIWMQNICLSVWVIASIIRAMPIHIEWGNLFAPAFFILIGVSDLITGIHFKRLERE